MKSFVKIDECVGKILISTALLCFVALFAILSGNFLIRVLALGNIMGWYTDVSEILFGWMVMLTASVLARRREHFRIDLLDMYLADRRGFHILCFLTNAVAFLFFAVLFYYGTRLFLNASQTMPVLGITRRWAYLCIPFNAVFLTLYSFRDAVRSFMTAIGLAPATKRQ